MLLSANAQLSRHIVCCVVKNNGEKSGSASLQPTLWICRNSKLNRSARRMESLMMLWIWVAGRSGTMSPILSFCFGHQALGKAKASVAALTYCTSVFHIVVGVLSFGCCAGPFVRCTSEKKEKKLFSNCNGTGTEN